MSQTSDHTPMVGKFIHSSLLPGEHLAPKFIREDDTVLVLPSDHGTAMDKAEYDLKLNNHGASRIQ